jgi:hypothetical protein
MAIVTVREIRNERDSFANFALERKYKRTFRVTVNDTTTGPLTAESAPGIPRRGDRYADPNGLEDVMSIAMEIHAHPQEDDNPYEWLVTVDYNNDLWRDILRRVQSGGRGNASNPNDPPSPSNSPLNPINRPAEIIYGAIDAVFVQAYDADLAVVQNSAHELFEPMLERPIIITTITIVRNEPTYDPSFKFRFINKVNSSTSIGIGLSYANGLVKCKSITAQSAEENGFTFWRVNHVFHICPTEFVKGTLQADGTVIEDFDSSSANSGWNRKDALLLDCGWNERVAGKLKPIVIGDGQRVNKAPKLNAAGLQLPDGNPAKFIQFRAYKSIDFAPLNLP